MATEVMPRPKQLTADAGDSYASPWIAAKHEWNERYGDLISRARNWRAAAFLALVLALVEAAGLIADCYRLTAPFELARTETVAVAVSSVLPSSNRSYEVEWTETTRNRAGGGVETQNSRGVFTIAVNPPADERLARVNPLGI